MEKNKDTEKRSLTETRIQMWTLIAIVVMWTYDKITDPTPEWQDYLHGEIQDIKTKIDPLEVKVIDSVKVH